MSFNKDQIEILARYFADFSKILTASVIVWFFIPVGGMPISFTAFGIGTLVTVACLALSVKLLE